MSSKCLRRSHAAQRSAVVACAESGEDEVPQRASGTATRQREEDTDLSISSVGDQALLSEREVCDEFVCTSSPVVALNVRQIVTDIQQRRDLTERSASYIADNIEFSDNWISLRGREAYVAHDLWKSGFQQPGQPRIVSLTMLATDTFEVKYAVSDAQLSVGGLAAGFDVCETFVFNLISGRAVRHSVKIDVVQGGPLASLCLLGLKVFSSAVERGGLIFGKPGDRDNKDKEKQVFVDPRDPNRFFYQQDDSFNDSVQILIAITAIYAVVQALRTLL